MIPHNNYDCYKPQVLGLIFSTHTKEYLLGTFQGFPALFPYVQHSATFLMRSSGEWLKPFISTRERTRRLEIGPFPLKPSMILV